METKQDSFQYYLFDIHRAFGHSNEDIFTHSGRKRPLITFTLSSFFPNESPLVSFGTMKHVMPLYPLEMEVHQNQKVDNAIKLTFRQYKIEY